ncbi:MAG: hypothetical protein AAF707_00775 [Pseudomonadota bacterium]
MLLPDSTTVTPTHNISAREDVRHYVRESVDVFVQLERLNGKRRVSRILVGA